MSTTIKIFSTMIAVLVITGFFMHFVKQGLNQASSEYSMDEVTDTLSENSFTENLFEGFAILGSIVAMFFWDFGLPWWINIVMELFRVTLYICIIFLLRGVG